MASSDKPGFSLSHARNHDGWCFHALQAELEQHGYESVAPTYDVEDGKNTLSDHAKVLEEAEAELSSPWIIRAGWSWGFNVVLFSAITERIRAIVSIAGTRHDIQLAHTLEYDLFQRGLQANPSRENMVQLGIQLYYRDVGNKLLQIEAAQHLRSHPKVNNEPPLEVPPDIPIYSIIPTKDKITPVVEQKRLAEALGAEKKPFPGGHAAPFEKPRKLARTLISIAEQTLT